MAGIYIHIPYCKQACTYCNFHFSTNRKSKNEMLKSLANELVLQSPHFHDETIQTLYFGGGTPSLLAPKEIEFLWEVVIQNYNIIKSAEITLEGNPDDFTKPYLQDLKSLGVNRLSIGVQTFDDKVLKSLHRAHTNAQSHLCIQEAQKLFQNISVDVIYGLPQSSSKTLNLDLQHILQYQVQHLSAYALTVEPKTPLKHQIDKGMVTLPTDDKVEAQFFQLKKTLEQNGFGHYELSNFAKPDFVSKHNTSYWNQISYLGIGPGAHSYYKGYRFWNVSNNQKYIKSLSQNEIPQSKEVLSENDSYNEFVMLGLRRKKGIDITALEARFGTGLKKYLLSQAAGYLSSNHLIIEMENGRNNLKTTPKGIFLTDGISAQLFKLD